MIWQAEEGAMRALRLMRIVKSAKKDLNINLKFFKIPVFKLKRFKFKLS